MSRFDPAPDKPYAHCTNCESVLQTQQEAREHMKKTFEDSPERRGHRIRVTNPDRQERIRNAIDSTIEDALGDVFTSLDKWIDRREVTSDEIREALHHLSWDVSDSWDEWRNEDD